MTCVTILKNDASRSARLLAADLRRALNGIKVGVARVADTRTCRCTRYVVNWGVAAQPLQFQQGRLVMSNTPQGVAVCRDKIKTLRALEQAGVPCLEWADHDFRELRGADDVRKLGPTAWLEADKKIVVRHTTTGHSGAGIEIVRLPEGGARGQERLIPAAPLYTRYFRKDAEYRVHVMSGVAIHVQQKRRRNGHEFPNNEDHLIRTHANGYVFTTQNLDCDVKGYRDALTGLATRAAAACGVSHAAVDILVRHSKRNTAQPNIVVCELNSAPAVDAESTRNAYVQGFAREIQRAAAR